MFCFFCVQHLKSLQSHYTTHTQLSVVLSPRAFFFISQHGKFETQPTQTTFTVWQMKLINNLKHALTVSHTHTIMSLKMFLSAREDASQQLSAPFSLSVQMKGKYKHDSLFCFLDINITAPYCTPHTCITLFTICSFCEANHGAFKT